MADEILVKWGENIARHRRLRTPDGGLRRNKLSPEMSQKDLGDLLGEGVSQATVSRWERGLMEPRRKHKKQIADALSVDPAALFPLPQSDVA